ncbi:probable cyclin-dependent serine/threonine-protein kinase DDB_G0292550 isoform X2 [Drosophila albomicans]|uniref:Probable cyclin-dependent serine/threonine-protein kinase DDB_G0292550 isoform X2 n=1 Tax=Drosophila albomicans TaxID=7291 RepID=A0A6P8Y3A7_DROAB|nr:probable cyclin-dependent serine/threonine-protein kinase DDB_G0292550 isoform X2 [Drosophila albomicans]
MTSFNTAAVSMNLDEYYDHFVVPKPEIPKIYPGCSGQTKKRQAAHLQSYKDNDAANDEDDGDDDELELEQTTSIDDEFDSSIQDSTNNQIDYETNEFNQLYEDDNSQKNTEQSTTPATSEASVGSGQQRGQATNNMNRPPGAASIDLNETDGGGNLRAKQRKSKRFVPFNNNNRNRIPVQQRLGTKNHREQFLMRNGSNALFNNHNIDNYNGGLSNAFNHNNNYNNNNANFNINSGNYDNNNNANYNPNMFNSNMNNSNYNNGYNPQQQISINSSNDLQHSLQASREMPNLNSLQTTREMPNLVRFNPVNDNPFYSSLIIERNFENSNLLNSLMNPANQISNNNMQNRLGPQYQARTANDFALGNIREQTNGNTQTRFVPNNSLRLADLVNMDRNTFANMTVAKNAIMLLRTTEQHSADKLINKDK